jgi:signal peptidase I
MEKALKFLLWTLGIFILVAGIGRAFFFETWVVPEGSWIAASTAPTLAGGDLVLVSTIGQPDFGELARCTDPEDPSYHVVGRIAGTGGDLVELRGPILSVNGKRYVANEACKEAQFTVIHPDTGNEVTVNCARIEMGAGWHFRGQMPKAPKNNDVRKKVGEGKVYLLSDNRDIHDDSRDFGSLPEESCTGRIFFRLWGKEGWMGSESRLTYIR